MKFLKLLDPFSLQTNDITAPGRQQEQAALLFPKLVEQSNLHYWRPNDEIVSHGLRLLVGLAATFDLKDLRLADIINEQLDRSSSVHVDVFNVASDCSNFADLANYYPVEPASYVATPMVGFWRDGKFESVESGFEARRLILEAVGSSVSAEESVSNLAPPDPSLMDG